MKLRIREWAAASLLAWGASTGCSDANGGGTGPRNLLLVTLDTTRADRLGCYGHTKAITPTLDSLAERGVLFEQAISATPITLPSHASLLTGQHPFTHGARNNGSHFLPPEAQTLAETLQSAGFDTGASISAFVLDSRFGLDQGFDTYDDDLSAGSGGTESGYRETRAGNTLARARKWIESRPAQGERWFLWVHLFDPHSDYSPPPPFNREPADPYDGEIAYVDSQLGTFLAWLDVREQLADTLVAVTADHGESLGEHGETTHGIFLYDATTRVPLILSHASLPQGVRRSEVVGSVDLMPTLLDLLGVAQPAGIEGRTVASELRESAAIDPAPVYSESMMPYYGYGWAGLAALRDAQWRYVRAPRPELYDLVADGRELDNVHESKPDEASHYSAALDALLPLIEADSATQLDDEVESALAGLGYVFAAEDAPAEGEERPDPKDRIEAVSGQQTAEGFLLAGRYDEAAALYRRLVDENPTALNLRTKLGNALVLQEKLNDALTVHRGSLSIPGVGSDTALAVADLERELGISRWIQSIAIAKKIDSRDPLPWVREGEFYYLPKNPDAAESAFKKALELDDQCAAAWLGLCKLAIQRRQTDEALAAATRVTQIDPQNFAGWFQRGMMSAARQDLPAAQQCLMRARDLEPGDATTRIRLAMVHLMAKDEVRALAELRVANRLDPEQVQQMVRSSAVVRDLHDRL